MALNRHTMTFSKDKRQETVIYLVLWGLLFMAPIMSLYIRTTNDTSLTFDWDEVLMVWRQYGLYFAVFLVHNHLLAPLLVYKQKKLIYFSIVIALVGAFTFYQCQDRPERHAPRMEKMERPDRAEPPGRPEGPEGMERPDRMERPELMEGPDHPEPPKFADDGAHRPHGLRHFRPNDHRPPVILSQHDVIAVIILILMLGMNLGVKLYFKQKGDQRHLTEMERKNLEQQLEYLKYQLNPHFLMNALNNIHALVDIDPERSKEAIIQLSKILRYVLYETDNKRVPLNKELEFMKNYTDLMRMRYGGKLQFTDSSNLLIPSSPEQSQMIPPLLFVSFVENAFKHGVSYQQPSFIEITGKRYKDKQEHDRLLWSCRNSKHQKQQQTTVPQQGGVGMANVRQRLDIIFGNNYTLNVNETDDTYEVTLDIPMEEDVNTSCKSTFA